MGHRLVVMLGLVVLLAACGGNEAVTTTTAPTTAASTMATALATTTASSTSTTTTTTGPGISIADLVAPTDVLDGFRFTATALDDDGEAGLVASGVFVAPDAVECTIGNPAWMSPRLGTLTAIGSSAWWNDAMGTTPQARGDIWGLMNCPGAPEFWELPLMSMVSGGVFALGDSVPAEEIEGFATDLFTLSSLDPTVVLDEASLWVTDEGWPIKMQVHGTAPGGVVAVRGEEADDPVTPKAFALGFELTDINAASLVVRAPDGSAMAGPIGGVEVSLPDLGAPSPELQAAIDSSLRQGCVTTNTPLTTLEPLGMEAGLGHLEVVGTMEGFEGATQVNPSTFVTTSPEDRVVTTDERAEARRAHALLFFSYIAPVVTFFSGFDALEYSSLPLDADGRLDLAVWSAADEDAPRVATWDGETIEFEDGSILEIPAPDLMHTAYGALLSDTVLEEGWNRVQAFAAAAVQVVPGIWTGDPQALTDMRAIGDQLEEMRALGCALLGHHWQLMEDFIQSGSGDTNTALALAASEQKAQSLLLFLDYLQVIVRYLEGPDVDWLEAEGVVLEDTLLPDDSAGEYLNVISKAAAAMHEFMAAFESLGAYSP